MKKASFFTFLLTILFFLGCKEQELKEQIISLNGEWQIAETNQKDTFPEKFTSKISVPSLIDLATPKFPKLEYPNDTLRYFWYQKTFSVNHESADVVELELRKVKYEAHIYINGKKAGQQNIAFSSGKFDIKKSLLTLQGDVVISTSTGYVITTEKLITDLDEFSIETTSAISGKSPIGTLNAGKMRLDRILNTENVHLNFTNGVKLLYRSINIEE